MEGVKYKCETCNREFFSYPFYALHSSQCDKQPNMNYEDKPHEFPITDQSIQDVKRVMDQQDDFGIKKYGKPLDWRDNYSWREMKLQELADYIKYDYCEYQEKLEAIRILNSALQVGHAENKDTYIKYALEILTKINTGK